MKARGGHELRHGAGHRIGRGHDRGVREQPGGCEVLVPRERLPRLPQIAHRGQLAPATDVAHAVGAPPRVLARCGRRQGADVLELLERPVELARLDQAILRGPTQLHEHLDVQCGVVEPVHGQRALGPVHRRVLLGQRETQQLLRHGGEPHLAQSEQPAAQFGVEEPVRVHVQFGEARHVLGGRMQHPLDVAQGLVHDRQRSHGFGIDQDRARALAAQLYEECALAVAEPRGPFGVDRHGTGGRGELFRGPRQTPGGVHHAREALRGAVEMHGRGDVQMLESRDHDLGWFRCAGGTGVLGVAVDGVFLEGWIGGGAGDPHRRTGRMTGAGYR